MAEAYAVVCSSGVVEVWRAEMLASPGYNVRPLRLIATTGSTTHTMLRPGQPTMVPPDHVFVHREEVRKHVRAELKAWRDRMEGRVRETNEEIASQTRLLSGQLKDLSAANERLNWWEQTDAPW